MDTTEALSSFLSWRIGFLPCCMERQLENLVLNYKIGFYRIYVFGGSLGGIKQVTF